MAPIRKTNLTKIPTQAEVETTIRVVIARLDAEPKDERDWQIIVDQLREAAHTAQRIANHLAEQSGK